MHDNVYDCRSSKTLKEVIKIIKDWIKRGKEEEWVEAGRSQFTICVIQLKLSKIDVLSKPITFSRSMLPVYYVYIESIYQA